jgi:mono/diheme cytochrome c family protein
MCHGTQLEGGAGPALDGPNFKTLNDKVHATVSDVFGYITTNMPMNAPASLTHDQYVDVMAFILSKNGYKPGAAALTWTTANASTAHVVNEGR